MLKFLSLLFLAAFASGQLTYQLCEEGVTCFGDLITDPENIEAQAQLVTEDLCSDPDLDPCDADKCRLHLPELWRGIAGYMWPLAFSTDEARAWWCNGVGVATTSIQEETCDACVAGLEYIRDVLLSDEAINFVVKELQGPDFCGQAGGSGKGKGKGKGGKGKGKGGKGNGKGKGKGRGMRAIEKNQYLVNRGGDEEWSPEICAQIIEYVIPRAFHALAEAGVGHEETVCNHCFPTICSDYTGTGTGTGTAGR